MYILYTPKYVDIYIICIRLLITFQNVFSTSNEKFIIFFTHNRAKRVKRGLRGSGGYIFSEARSKSDQQAQQFN